MNSCSIGQQENSECHKTSFSRKVGLKNIHDLSSTDKSLLLRRSSLSDPNNATVCYHHEKIYLEKYSFLQQSCCDPYNHHPNASKKKSLHVIDVHTADRITLTTNKAVHPGEKLCPSCRKHSLKDDESETEVDEMDYINLPAATSREDSEAMNNIAQEQIYKLNLSLTDAGFSPLKVQKVSQRDRISYGKRKAFEVKDAVVQQLATSLRIPPTILNQTEALIPRTCEMCADLQLLVDDLKVKMEISCKKEKLMILTLAPQSWTIEKTAAEFGVSTYMVKKARMLKKTDGILPDLAPKKGRQLGQATVDKVIAIYVSDEFSRMCPGQKEYVTIRVDGQKIQKQKRLLLINLKEMYEQFKMRESQEKIGISKFCELRPRWCVTVGSRGSHSVCVCAIHQNVKLLVAALQQHLDLKDYKDLLTAMVCDSNSRECMIHRCKNCPGNQAFSDFLMNLFSEVGITDEDNINFKQWDNTERGCNIITRCESVGNFVDELCKQMKNLTVHHFIAKSQAAFLTSCKDNLTSDTALVLLDFAENYSFIVQDAIQGHHWNNSQATLHPFTIYHSKDQEVQCISICVINDCMQHDSISVHVFIKIVSEYIKSILPDIMVIKYFSDGAASQYKNYKIFKTFSIMKKTFI